MNNNSSRVPLYIAIGAIVVGVLLLLVFAVLLLRSSGDKAETGQEGTPTPPALEPGGSGLGLAGSGAGTGSKVQVVGVSNSATISVSLEAPALLVVAGQRFPLQADRVPPEGRWQPAMPAATSAVWVEGTVVNYVVGLADTPENRALLDGLSPGDLMSLTSRSGVETAFTFDRREVVPASNAAVFAQNSPGLTLVLLGTSGDNRLTVHGRYVVPDASSSAVSSVVELGETAQLEDLAVTVTGTTFQFDRPEAPAGFAFFLVDFELANAGTQVLDTSDLNLALHDQFGNQYALNTVAAQFGNHPVPTGSLRPGQTVMASAGYQVPASLSSGSLRWVVERANGPGRVEVNIPFSGDESSAQSAIVTLAQAEVSLDGTSLTLQGQVTNLSNQRLVIAESDVSLVSGGTIYLLFSTNPGFPWVAGPGQTVPFFLMFQRPAEPSAVFTVLTYPFALEGLR